MPFLTIKIKYCQHGKACGMYLRQLGPYATMCRMEHEEPTSPKVPSYFEAQMLILRRELRHRLTMQFVRQALADAAPKAETTGTYSTDGRVINYIKEVSIMNDRFETASNIETGPIQTMMVELAQGLEMQSNQIQLLTKRVSPALSSHATESNAKAAIDIRKGGGVAASPAIASSQVAQELRQLIDHLDSNRRSLQLVMEAIEL